VATHTSRLTMAAGSAAADGGAASPWAIRSGDLPALLTSLLVHVIVLLALGLVVVDPGAPAPSVTVIESAAVVEDELPLDPEEMVVADEPLVEAGAGLDQSAGVAQALAPVVADVSVTPVTETDVAGTVQLEPLDTLPTAQAFDERIVVRGATGVASTGAAGAVDRLTAEIAASLDQRPTVVCWVFDRSVSLSAQRQEIAGRLTRVFDELGANRSLRNRPSLSNLVVAFGKDVQLLTPKPTAEVAEVIEAINAVPVDESGVEMTFHAVRAAAEAARIFRTSAPKRNVMIVVFTDEVGNDVDTADAATKLCLTLGIPVYVVGVPAPFGIREVRMKYVEFDPKYDQGEQWAVIEQGPETGFPEVVHIRSDRLADEAIDSGFGPFRLSKLCADTGGIYFRVHGSSDQRGRVTNQMIQPMQSQLRYFFDPPRAGAGHPQEQGEVGIGRGGPVLPDRPDGFAPNGLSAPGRGCAGPAPHGGPADRRPHRAAGRRPPFQAVGRPPRSPRRDGAALAGGLRSRARPRPRRQGPHRCLQPDARPGEAGDEVQGRAERHLDARAE